MMSAWYHNVYDQKESQATFWRSYDMAGISAMIMCSATPPFYYGMMCHSWGMIWLYQVWFFAIIAFVIAIKPSLAFGKKWVLALAFIVAGYSTVPGMIHATYYLPEDDIKDFPMSSYLIGGLIYAGGAIIHSLSIPERFLPGKFDTFGNSHNIFHTCCVIAAMFHWHAAIKTYHLRMFSPCVE